MSLEFNSASLHHSFRCLRVEAACFSSTLSGRTCQQPLKLTLSQFFLGPIGCLLRSLASAILALRRALFYTIRGFFGL